MRNGGPLRILVTGASGFVGQALLRRLSANRSFTIRACSREARSSGGSVEWCIAPPLSAESDWASLLRGVDSVVHLAARVHMMAEGPGKDDEYRRVNVLGTVRLATQAAEAGVRRLVFLSSIKVNGERGLFTEFSAPAPSDAYGLSKYDAELGLRQTAERTSMEVVILRPPLVYGPSVKANFRALLVAVRRGIPLPLASIDNRRSLVAVDNLTSLIESCLTHPAAVSQTFLVSDGEDLSTPELARRLAAAVGTSARLIPVPVWALLLGGRLMGRSDAIQRLTDSLQVDSAKATRLLGWRAPLSVNEGLRRAAMDEESS